MQGEISQKEYLSADYVVCSPEKILRDGVVVLCDGKVEEVGRREDFAESEVKNSTSFKKSVIFPGFINLHSHLEYSRFSGEGLSQESFGDWIGQVVQLKAKYADVDFLAQATLEGARELMRCGVTSVVNIHTNNAILSSMKEDPQMRVWWCLELIDVRGPAFVEDSLRELEGIFRDKKWKGGVGLSPHAPYSASVDCYSLATKKLKQGDVFTSHIAETEEEEGFFQKFTGQTLKKGELFDQILEKKGLPGKAILAHVNTFSLAQVRKLSTLGVTVVHCPQTHAYFKRKDFPLKLFAQNKIPVCLGTDSSLSSPTLNLLDEVRAFISDFIGTGEELLSMITTLPANALGLKNKLGILKKGAYGDLGVFKLPEGSSFSETPSDFLIQLFKKIKTASEIRISQKKVDINEKSFKKVNNS